MGKEGTPCRGESSRPVKSALGWLLLNKGFRWIDSIRRMGKNFASSDLSRSFSKCICLKR